MIKIPSLLPMSEEIPVVSRSLQSCSDIRRGVGAKVNIELKVQEEINTTAAYKSPNLSVDYSGTKFELRELSSCTVVVDQDQTPPWDYEMDAPEATKTTPVTIDVTAHVGQVMYYCLNCWDQLNIAKSNSWKQIALIDVETTGQEVILPVFNSLSAKGLSRDTYINSSEQGSSDPVFALDASLWRSMNVPY